MTRRVNVLAALGLISAAAVPCFGQGTLSTQGLGFPPGLLGAKAQAMGGSVGEADGMSPLNPAAITLLGGAWVAMQAEPEFRELSVSGQKERTSVARFPLFVGSLPIGTRWGVMLSAATLFDRTWATTARDTQVIGTDTIGSTRMVASDGSVADLRFAVAYHVTDWLRVGIGAHAYSGGDALSVIRQFDDSVRFVGDTQRTRVSFGGSALSFGALSVWPRRGAVGVTYRRGGSMSTYHGSTVAHSAAAPDHFGVSVVYLGIAGTTLAARAATDSWSRLAGLSPTLQVHEAWDIGLGAEVLGPVIGNSTMGLRLGARWRTLPFSPNATAVRERTFSGGFGLPMGLQRAELNMAIMRATRTGPFGMTENAWTLSTGFAVRP